MSRPERNLQGPVQSTGAELSLPGLLAGATGVAAKELGRFFVGAKLEEEFCDLAERRIKAAVRGSLWRGISGVQSGTR